MISAERIEELDIAWNDSSFMSDEEYRDWYEELTSEEQTLIDSWDKHYSSAVLRLCKDILALEAKQT